MDIKLIPKEYNQKPAGSRGFKLPAIKFKTTPSLFKFNLWLGIAIALLIVSILGYLGLIFYKNSLDKDNLALEIQTRDKEPERDLGLEKQLIELERGNKNLEKFSKTHIYSSRLFQMLEELTISQVQWQKFEADIFSNEIDLRGQAINYNILAEEITTLENDSRINKVETSGIRLGAGGVNFNMALGFEPTLLKNQDDKDR